MCPAFVKAIKLVSLLLIVVVVPLIFLVQSDIDKVSFSTLILVIQAGVYLVTGIWYRDVLKRGKGAFDPKEISNERGLNLSLAGFSFAALTFVFGLSGEDGIPVENLIPYLGLAFGLFAIGALLIEFGALGRAFSYVCPWIRYVGFTSIFLGLVNLSLKAFPYSTSVIFVAVTVVILALWLFDLTLWLGHLKLVRQASQA